jgi:hypothetical protein
MARRNPSVLFVDRTSQQWVLRDPAGDFWVIPPMRDAWEHRQPFYLSEASELEPVPRHYIHMLELPFDPGKDRQ